MFDYRKMRETMAAALLAVILSATAIGAAVGPARAIETDASIRTPAQVA